MGADPLILAADPLPAHPRPREEGGWTPNARTVFEKRYLRRDGSGRPLETPEDLLWRVARHVALAEKRYARSGEVERRVSGVAEEFYRMMVRREFLPNSPTLMNAGRDLGQCFACFVLPVADSLSDPAGEGIFDAVRAAALIHQSGGGTGFSFSRLRPEGARVSSTHGSSSGPISFLRVFNAATEAIHQGGFSRGANMGVLRVDHPDILDFIRIKDDPRAMTNFNLSVAITQEFLDALRADALHVVVDPASGNRGPLRSKRRDALGVLVGFENRPWSARELWALLAECAWKTGEPGVLFLDRINRFNPTPQMGNIEATNPCGEMPLLPWEACNLGSINLGRFAGEEGFHWDRLASAVRLAVRFLDDVIDATRHPLAAIERVVLGNRKTGLGVMGWADALFRMGIPYDSARALELAVRVMKAVRNSAWEASLELARERGSFPNFEGSLFTEASLDHPYFPEAYRRACDAARDRVPMRNATVTTVAPAGTISILAGASGGIEPLYALSYRRQVLDGSLQPEFHPTFEEVAGREGWLSLPQLHERLLRGESARSIPEIPARWREIFACAYDVPPEGHLRMQAAFQAHTDNAVSKTVNFPSGASAEDVKRAYELSVELEVKGVTVYRDGSRERQPMSAARACPECGAPLPGDGSCAIESCPCDYSRCS